MTTTPNPTAEQIVAEELYEEYNFKSDADALEAARVAVAALRAQGLLGGDPTEDHAHRPEPILAYVETDCAICNCEHESECPMREVLICSECTRIAETASPGWLERTFDFSLVKWPCAAAGVAPQELSAHANPLVTSGERVRNQTDSSHVAPQEPSPVASTPTVSDDSGHGGDDDRGGREDGPEDEGRSHQATVAGTPQRPSGCAECHRASGHKMDCSHRLAPSPDREKLIAEARKAQKAVYLAAEKSVADDLARIIGGLADALAAQPVLDPEKVAEVIRDELRKGEYASAPDELPYAATSRHIARSLCEAAKRGELSA